MITLFGCEHFFNFVYFLLYPTEVKRVCNVWGRVGVIKIVIVINCNLITFSKVMSCNCN